jgi:hypothetical protein
MRNRLTILLALAASFASAGDLTFLADAINPGNGKRYKAYLDQSTIRRVGTYESVKLVSIYENPISAAGFAGVKSMVNIFQVDCRRHVKRVTYIGFLNAAGKVIVEEKFPNAPDEPFGVDTVDLTIKPYLCISLTDPVR